MDVERSPVTVAPARSDWSSAFVDVEEKAPLRRTVTQMEVGGTAAFLLSDLASDIFGQTIYVNAGYCITGM